MVSKETDFLKKINYYGINHFAISFYVNNIRENIESLTTIVGVPNHPIDSIEDVYLFLWLLSFKEFVLKIDNYDIENDLKTQLKTLSNNTILNTQSFIDYVNSYYFSLFDSKKHESLSWHDFFEKMMELCYAKYSKGIKADVFCFLESNYSLNILCHFDCCYSYYQKHKKSFMRLFYGLEKTRVFDDQIYIRFLINYPDKKDPFLKEQAKFICERSIAAMKSMCLTSDDEKIIEIQSLIQDYNKLASLYHLECFSSYLSFIKDLSTKLDDFIKKHGIHHTIGPVDLKPAIDILKDETSPYKFLLLTHREEKDKGRMINCFNDVLDLKNDKNPLSEAFRDISRSRSDKYPYYKQDYMQYTFWIRNRIVNLIFQDEQLTKELLDYLYNVSLQLQNEYFSMFVDIEKEVDAMADSLVGLMDLAKRNLFDTPYCKMLIYSLSLSMCTTIEKILRNAALKEISNTKYCDFSKTGIGDYLGSFFNLCDISDGTKYYLEFYLIREINFAGHDVDRPGLNIRNNLMHGTDDAYEKTDYGTLLTLFNLFLSLFNDLALSIGEKE